MHSRQRRHFLRTVLEGAGGALLTVGSARFAGRALAQAGADPLPPASGGVLPSVSDGAAVHGGEGRLDTAGLRGKLHQLSGAGGNIVLLGGSSGVALIDSGAPEHEKRILSLVAERFGGAPIELLFNTHWHLGHTGGNDAIGRDGAKIIAHENTRLWMSTEFYVDWQDRTYSARPPSAQPTQTFYSSDPQPITLDYAGEKIEYALLQEAHTDGDIYVRFPGLNVIVAGGAVTVGRYPVLDYATGGSIRGLIDATQTLIDLTDAETLIVPAIGPAQRRSHLEAQLDMLSTVRERMQMMARQGKSAEEMRAAGITKEFDARWGSNAARFLSNAYDSVWAIGR